MRAPAHDAPRWNKWVSVAGGLPLPARPQAGPLHACSRIRGGLQVAMTRTHDNGTTTTRILYDLDSAHGRDVSWMHDIAVSDDHLVLFEHPLVFRPKVSTLPPSPYPPFPTMPCVLVIALWHRRRHTPWPCCSSVPTHTTVACFRSPQRPQHACMRAGSARIRRAARRV